MLAWAIPALADFGNNGGNYGSALGSGTTSGVVTNDATELAWERSNGIQDPGLQADARGAMQIISAAGFRANLQDWWINWPRYTVNGTNASSLYTSSNPCPFGGVFTNQSITASTNCTAILTLPNPTNAWTVAISAYCPGNTNGSATGAVPPTYRIPWFGIYDTNSGNGTILYQDSTTTMQILVMSNGVVSYYSPSSSTATNSIQKLCDNTPESFGGGNVVGASEIAQRYIYVVSSDGLGHVVVWINNTPCTFRTNGAVNTAESFTLNTASMFVVTNAMNRIVLGWFGAVNTLSGARGGFGGTIDSILAFGGYTSTNAVTSAGVILPNPLASVAFAASSVFNPATTYDHEDGTSEKHSGDFAWFLQNSQPYNWWIDDRTHNGANLAGQTNILVSGVINASSIDSFPVIQYPYNDLIALSQYASWHWKQRILASDLFINDALTSGGAHIGTNALTVWRNVYYPLKTNGCLIYENADHVNPLNPQMGSLDLLIANANTWIDKVIPEFKYDEPQGMVANMADGGFSSAGGDWDGTNVTKMAYAMVQWANLYQNIPPVPYNFYTNTFGFAFVPIIWPTYTVTLSGSPAAFTNIQFTPDTIRYVGGVVTGIGIDGSQAALPLTGGSTELQPLEWIQFTNSGVPTFTITPHP